MGIVTNKDNVVTITDNDNIEISNLNRQFLFKKKNQGDSKSITAANEFKNISNNFNCIVLDKKVGLETENIFDETFWNSQNYIINAVDNLEARI